jgi:hypothetical protein
MLRVVQAKASHSTDILRCQRSKKKANVDNLISNIVVPKDIAGDDMRLFRFGDVGLAVGEDGITIVDSVIFGKKPDESLGCISSRGFNISSDEGLY